jgi:hypothetical protein
MGESGSGKTTSLEENKNLGIKGLNPKETFIISIGKNELPFIGWKVKYKPFTKDTKETANVLFSDNTGTILKVIEYINEFRPDVKNLVIDDTNLSASKTFFNRYNETGWEKFNQIGGELGNLLMIKDTLRSDLNNIYIFHVDTYETPTGKTKYKAKTIGKVVDDKLDPPTKFNIVIHATCDYNPLLEKNERWFYNNDYPGSPAKSPYGMFSTNRTINDMGLILDTIKKYEECEDC